MILLADIGNTCVKLALSDGRTAGPVARRDYDEAEWEEWLGRADEVHLSCVGPNPDALFRLAADKKKKVWRVRELAARDGHVPATLFPDGLGEDRCAAIRGARRRAPGRDVLVVDCGTCLTTDLVTAGGRHLGGIISPGLRLRLESMHEHTAALPQVSCEGEAPLWAFTTDEAMRGGAMNGLRFEIEGYIREARKMCRDVKVFYTGGLPLALGDEAEVYPNLVLEGLL